MSHILAPSFFSTFAVPLRSRSAWEPPQLISQAEAAHHLGVSRTTIWRLVSTAELEAVRIGARTLISRGSIDRYIERNSSNGVKR